MTTHHSPPARSQLLTTSPSFVDPVELEALRRDATEIQILDVRTPAEFESAHIPGHTTSRSISSTSTPRRIAGISSARS